MGQATRAYIVGQTVFLVQTVTRGAGDELDDVRVRTYVHVRYDGGSICRAPFTYEHA